MRLTLAFACLTLFACDFGRSRAPDERPEAFNAATVAGVVTLPDGIADAEAACKGLTVEARAGNSAPMGRVSVHQSRGRCSYSLTRLPQDAQLALSARGEGWTCQNGAVPTFSPDAKTVTLKEHETLTQDFKADCTNVQSRR